MRLILIAFAVLLSSCEAPKVTRGYPPGAMQKNQLVVATPVPPAPPSTPLTPQEEAYQASMTFFGITMHAPLKVPTCKSLFQNVRVCSPSGLSCWSEKRMVQDFGPVCYFQDKQQIRFSRDNQPNWARGPIDIGLDAKGRIVRMEFQATSSNHVLEELYKRFGMPTGTTSETTTQAGTVGCIQLPGQVIDCGGRAASQSTSYTQIWRRNGLEVLFNQGNNVVTFR